MRTHTVVKTIKTVCGKQLSYLEIPGQNNKMHSVEGPAIIYPESENKAPEYYLFGIKHTKAEWKILINQHKPLPTTEPMPFSSEY